MFNFEEGITSWKACSSAKKCEEEIKFICTEVAQRAVVLELRNYAEESKLEYEFEDALAKEDIIDEELG